MGVTVGLNCAHDASVCISVDGKILFAMCEDRINRRKHSSGFPIKALESAIDRLGSRLLLESSVLVLNQHPPADYSYDIGRLLPEVESSRIFINPSHHLLHALYAISASGLDDTAVLVLDGSGYSYGEYLRRGSPLIEPGSEHHEAQEAWTLFKYLDGKLSVDARNWELWIDDKNNRFRFPSLGHMYSLAAQILFGRWTDAGKVMGLAAYGDPDALDLTLVHLEEEGIKVDVDWVFKLPQLNYRGKNLEYNVNARNLAAKVQAELERGVLHLCRLARRRTGAKNLCLTGGVALNTVCNTLVRQLGLFDEIFITPAAHDSGVAIGAAAYGVYVTEGRIPNFSIRKEFLGEEFEEREILKVLEQQAGVEFHVVEDAFCGCVNDLLAGLVVGWFEGKAEFGPRALGHRSILADPRVPEMKDRINSAIKFREAFRPFAASVLVEHVTEFFNLQYPSPFMLFVASAKPYTKTIAPAVIHADGSCRLQTVSSSYSGGLRQVLELFYSKTGLPLLLNTSLNLAGEPLCERPEDAVRTLLQSGLDVLYLHGYRVEKKNRNPCSLHSRIPAFFETTRVVRTSRVDAKAAMLAISDSCLEVGGEYTTRKRRLTRDEDHVLSIVDGQRTVAEISTAMEGVLTSKAVEEILLQLNSSGAIYFGSVRSK